MVETFGTYSLVSSMLSVLGTQPYACGLITPMNSNHVPDDL